MILAALLLAAAPPPLVARTSGRDVAGLLRPGLRVIAQSNADVSPEPGVERVALVGAVGDAGAVTAVGLVVSRLDGKRCAWLASAELATPSGYAVTLGSVALDLDRDGVVEVAVDAAAGEGARGVAETTWYAVRGDRLVPLYTLMRRRTVAGEVETRALRDVDGRLEERVERRRADGTVQRSTLTVAVTPRGAVVVDWERD